MKQIEVIYFPTQLIDPSPYQVRERFDPESLGELAESVREHGIIQPLTARVSPVDGGRLELVAGERRLRAGKQAGLEVVPVIVHELTDRAAQEIVLIENLQREDLTVSEEARGYRKALDLRDEEDKPVYTQASLAQKIGKPLNHVVDRLKLLLCPEVLVAAVENDEVSLSTAMLVGRIPEVKAREAAAKRVLKPQIQEVPLNYEQTREMIREEFMVSLQKPGFDKEDENLLPVVMEGETRVMGGSCVGCPFLASATESRARNSAHDENLKGGASDLCTKPSCFGKKQDAAWKIVAQQAEAQNVRVIQGDGAREIFSRYGNGLNHDAAYVMLDAKPDYDDVGEGYHENKKTFRSLLKGADVEIVIARHPVTGQRVELAEKKSARLVARAKIKGKDVAAEIQTTADAEQARKVERAKEIRAQKLEKITLHEGVTDLAEAISRKGMDLDNLDYLFQMALDLSGADGMRFVKDWLEIKLPKGTATTARDYEADILRVVRERATTPEHWLGFITVAVLAKTLPWNGLKNEDLTELHARYGIKLKDLERRAEAILDAGTQKPDLETLRQGDLETATPETGDLETATPKGPSKTEILTGVQDSKLGMIMKVAEQQAREELKGVCRDWRAENPGRSVSVMAEDLLIPHELACEIVDELVDEKHDAIPDEKQAEAAEAEAEAQKVFEQQARAVANGSKPSEFIGHKPSAKQDPEAYKEWNAKRMKLERAAKKLAVLAA